MFSGLSQSSLLWIGIGLLVLLAGVWLAISASSSRDVLKGVPLLLDRTEEERLEEERAEAEDPEEGNRAG